MTTMELKHFLLWCAALNYTLLLVWSLTFIFAHDWMYRFHTSWFRLSLEKFDVLHYALISIYKIGILLLNVIPLAALYLIG